LEENIFFTLKLQTVIFIRDFNSRGHEISGYIDYAERMRTDDLEPVFLHKCRFLPKEFDLSYYNWETKIAISNTTANWQVIAENETGVILKNKKDRKVLNVNPTAGLPGDNSTRTLVALYPREVISAYLLCLYSKP